MDTNPEILTPLVVVYWTWREECVLEVFWQISHTAPLPAKRVGVKGYPISSPLFFLPLLLLLCMLISHSHGIAHTLGPGQMCTHMRRKHERRRTSFCHASGAWMPGRERERDVFIHFLLCADRVLVQRIGKGAPDNEASVITELLQPLTTSIHWDQIKAFNCFASY